MPLTDTKIVPTGDRFDIDAANSSGLTLRVRGGVYVHQLGFRSAPNVALTLTASTTNYVEMDDAGVISTNTTGFTAGATQLYVVTTGAALVTGVADCRTVAGLTGGIDGVQVANNAASNVVGSLPVVFQIPIAAGALGDTDVVMTHKVRVIDAYLVLRGAGVSTTTLQVKNGTSAITNTMAASGSDTALVRAATIDDAAYTISAGGTLRVTSATGASQPDATVYVTALRVA